MSPSSAQPEASAPASRPDQPFERPVDAIRCAVAITEAVRTLGIEIRAGVTFGELELEWFPSIEVLFDGRNSLRGITYPADLRVLGVGVPPRGKRRETGSS